MIEVKKNDHRRFWRRIIYCSIASMRFLVNPVWKYQVKQVYLFVYIAANTRVQNSHMLLLVSWSQSKNYETQWFEILFW